MTVTSAPGDIISYIEKALILGLSLTLAAGCGSQTDIVVPNKPPLSAEAAKTRAEKVKQDRINSFKQMSKQQRKNKP